MIEKEGSRILLTEKVIGCAQAVSRTLGHGFLEVVYENALAVELEQAGIAFFRQKPIEVIYRGRVVGSYIPDFLIDERLLLELKAVRQLAREHESQVMNYLKATGFQVGLLMNFGSPRLGIKRIVWNYDNTKPI